MSLFFIPQEITAASSWLERLSPQVLSRGHELANEHSVKNLEWHGEPTGLAAMVQGGKLYELEIPFEKGRFWHSTCTCPYGVNCKHAAAALLLMVGQNSKAPPKKGAPTEAVEVKGKTEETLVELVQARVKKPLSTAAKAALSTMERWWQEKKRKIMVSDLFKISVQSSYWSRDAVEIYAKSSPPQDAWDYLACVEAEMTNLQRQLPDPIPSFIDRERQTLLVEALRDEVMLKQWKKQVNDWSFSIPDIDTAHLPELRLRLTKSGAIVEWRKLGQTEFVKTPVTALKNLQSHGLYSANGMILSAMRDRWGVVQTEFTRNELGLAEAVLQLLDFPQFRHALAGESGAPLIVHDEPLRWNIEDDSSGHYLLRLMDGKGQVPPEALFVIHSKPSWFVTLDAAWPLEFFPFGKEQTRSLMRIPTMAFESAEGVTVLRNLGLTLPKHLQDKIRTITANVTVQAKIRSDGTNRNAYVMVQARANYEAFALSESWGEQGWMPDKQLNKTTLPKPQAGEIITFNKAPLSSVSYWMGAFDLKPPSYGNYYEVWWERRITKDFPEQFLQWMAARPPDVIVELDKELASLNEGAVSGTVKLSVEETEMDWFDLRVALDVADVTLSPEEIKLLLKAQGRWVRIDGKGWRKLHFALTPEQEAEMAAMGLAVGDFDGEPQRLHALQLAGGLSKSNSLLPADHAKAVQRRMHEIQTRVQPDVPEAITATLRPYQLDGFHFLAYLSKNRFGGVLADDMGLGKTLQALAWIAWLRETSTGDHPRPVLVICPKSVQDNWRSETARFCPSLRVAVWSRDDAGDSGLDGETDILVIHYQQLRQHEEKLTAQRWLAVILDEAQAIKNPNSQTARSCCSIQAQHRLALSGTPIENRLLDLWSIMAFSMPGVLGNRTYFAKHFDSKSDPFARRRLASRVRPFVLRRTKKEVAQDLPDRIEEDIVCELEGSQQKLYQAELKRARATLLNVKTSKELDKARFNILTSLLRLRQICCHSALVLKTEVAATSKARKSSKTKVAKSSESGSAKLEALMELLEPIMEEGNKVLVFSQFVEMLELIRAQLESRQWPHFILTGKTDDRGALVESFQTKDGPAVFLISLKAGGSGLNLTAASYVVLCDPWWNPAVEAQAIDRTHRIGQTQKVNAYRLIVKDTIEEKIRLLQKNKSALANDILGEENFASALTLNDFQFLLGEDG